MSEIKILGKIYLDLTSEEIIDTLRNNTIVSRRNTYPVGEVDFKIKTDIMSNASVSDVMCACGYNPLGYGSGYNVRKEGEYTLFSCSGSCD